MSQEIEFDDINDVIAYRIAKASSDFRTQYYQMWNNNAKQEAISDYIGMYISKQVRLLFFEAVEFAEKLSEEKKDKMQVTYTVEIDNEKNPHC